METDLRLLLRARAQQVIPGASYNHHRLDPAQRDSLFYEVLLPITDPRRVLTETIMPAFTRYAQAKELDPERPKGVTVPVFLGDLCYLLRGEDLISLFCELEGLNWQAYHFRVLRWQMEG